MRNFNACASTQLVADRAGSLHETSKSMAEMAAEATELMAAAQSQIDNALNTLKNFDPRNVI